jgi:hypothetical protein
VQRLSCSYLDRPIDNGPSGGFAYLPFPAETAHPGVTVRVSMMMTLFATPMMGTFNLSNTLGDGMVLQRAPQQAIVWGFGAPGDTITTQLAGKAALSAKVGRMAFGGR